MNKKILWLASWYPSKLDAFTGDFIQRHARSLAAFTSVHVVFIVRDKMRKITNTVKIDEEQSGNLKESIIYYASPDFSLNAIEKLLSAKKYNKVYQDYFSNYFKKNGLPEYIHVQVPFKAGAIALWIKKTYGIDYFVTDHWSGYDRSNPDNFYSRPWAFRLLTKQVFKESVLITPVSEDLGKKIRALVSGISTKTISNAVDTSLFYSENRIQNKFRLIHYVSANKTQKNTEGLLRVLAKLKDLDKNWECVLFGVANDHLKEMVMKLGLNNRIIFTGEISYAEVAKWVRSSSAFVSFSNYENQPCSLLESLCSGVPVIATNVGGIPEIINQENGILIKRGNEIQLLEAIQNIMENISRYNRAKIADTAKSLYSFESVGKQLFELYK